SVWNRSRRRLVPSRWRTLSSRKSSPPTSEIGPVKRRPSILDCVTTAFTRRTFTDSSQRHQPLSLDVAVSIGGFLLGSPGPTSLLLLTHPFNLCIKSHTLYTTVLDPFSLIIINTTCLIMVINPHFKSTF